MFDRIPILVLLLVTLAFSGCLGSSGRDANKSRTAESASNDSSGETLGSAATGSTSPERELTQRLVGVWKSEVTQALPEGTQIISSTVDTYDEKGTFIDDTASELVDRPGGTSVVTVQATAWGTWKIENSELQKYYADTEISDFSTTMPGVTKEVYASMLQQAIDQNEPKRYTIVSSSEDQFTVIETKTKTQMTLNRTNQSPSASPETVKPTAAVAKSEADSKPAAKSHSQPSESASTSSDSPKTNRKLQKYPIKIDLPETAVRVDETTPLTKDTKLSCSWASRWLPVTVLAVHDDGTVRISWDNYSDSWDGDISRDCLIIEKSVLKTLQPTNK